MAAWAEPCWPPAKRECSKPRAPMFTSLKDGMQQLVDALVAGLPPTAFRPNLPCSPSIGKTRLDGVRRHDSDHFDAVIVATPATPRRAAEDASPELASELRAIPYSSSVTVTLGYDQMCVPVACRVWIPGAAQRRQRLLAATFVHNKFPHRAPEDRALVRCFLGGSRDEPISTTHG